jgi:hypothetical protein
MNSTQVTVTINEMQAKALDKLGLAEDAERLANSSFKTLIKSRFGVYAAKAEERVGKIYDEAVKNGFSAPEDRDTFIKRQTTEVQEILHNL